MDTTSPSAGIPAGSVVVGLDGSPAEDRALAWAVDQAVAEQRPLVLVHAVGPSSTMWLDPAGIDYRDDVASLRATAHRLLADARTAVHYRAVGLEIHEVVRVADPSDLLVELSQQAVVVVLGSRGRGPVRSLVLGSVGMGVTRRAACPVVVHRPSNPGLVRNGVVAGVDGSARSLPVLEFAHRQAALRDLPLTVVHCLQDLPDGRVEPEPVDPRSAEADAQRLVVAEALAGLAERYPEVRSRVELVRGPADAALVALAERANLLVVGAHAGSAVTAAVFGSVSATVVARSGCPVAVVPQTELATR